MQNYRNSVKIEFKNILNPVYFVTREEGEEVRNTLTKYIQDQLSDYLVEGSWRITYQPYFTFIYV